MKRLKHASMISVLILCLVGTFWLMAWAGEGAPEKINCDADITWEVAAEAKLTQFDCAVGEHGGRHPLPDPDQLAARLASCGIGPDTEVIAYDDSRLAFAARLWWLMKYFGHDCCALLDGGLAAWSDAGFALEGGVMEVDEAPLADLGPDRGMVLSALEVTGGLQAGGIVLADARTPARHPPALGDLCARSGGPGGARGASRAAASGPSLA